MTLTGSPDGSPAGSPLAAVPGADSAAAEAVALLPRRIDHSALETPDERPRLRRLLLRRRDAVRNDDGAHSANTARRAHRVSRSTAERIVSRRRSRGRGRRLPRRGSGAPPAASRSFHPRTPRNGAVAGTVALLRAVGAPSETAMPRTRRKAAGGVRRTPEGIAWRIARRLRFGAVAIESRRRAGGGAPAAPFRPFHTRTPMNRPVAGGLALLGAAGTRFEAAMPRTPEALVVLAGLPKGLPNGSPGAAVPGTVAADSPAGAVAPVVRRLGHSASRRR